MTSTRLGDHLMHMKVDVLIVHHATSLGDMADLAKVGDVRRKLNGHGVVDRVAADP